VSYSIGSTEEHSIYMSIAVRNSMYFVLYR